MECRVLGPLELNDRGRATTVSSPRQRTLLAALVVHARQVVSFDRLVDILWGERPPASARRSLHSHVSRLRKLLGDECAAPLRTCSSGYVLEIPEHAVDASRFEQLSSQARATAQRDAAMAVELFDEALTLWRGRAYADMADEDFARSEARRLEELRLVTVEDRIDAALVLGRHGETVGELEAMVAAEPLRERPRGQLMVALCRCGRYVDALASYRQFRQHLADELGLDPSPQLQSLEHDILRQAPQLSAGPPGPPVLVRESPPGDPSPPSDLPAQPPERRLSSFVGRQDAVDAVAWQLQRCRILTLTGVGGVGKTRLAEQVAGEVADRFPDGTWPCELASVREAEAVPHAIAAALGAARGARRAEESLLAALHGRNLLLILDNCEHVLSAVADIVGDIARQCPGVYLLATSRERLSVDGEQIWIVPPLTVPVDEARSVQDLREVASVRLFTDRAAAADPSFRFDEGNAAAVAELCRRLDGLPLAIELAAARIRSLPPAELVARLEERFGLLSCGPRTKGGRHRTLRATIDWSYGLLDETEAELFDRLSVFVGGFTLEAAERVCSGEGLGGRPIAAVLADLVDKSMVLTDHHGPSARYRLLETLREFGADRAAAKDQSERLAARHASYYLRLAETADVRVRGQDEARWVHVLDREFANLRAAQRWAIAQERADVALRLAAALYVYAIYRLRDEVSSWAEAALGLPGVEEHPLAAYVLGVVAHGVSNRGKLQRSGELAERALALASAPDDPARVPALVTLSVKALYEGRLDDCRRYADQAVELAEAAGRRYEAALVSLHIPLALAYGSAGAAAVAAAEDHHRRAEELANPTLLAWALYGRGEVLLEADTPQAIVLLEQAVGLARTVGNRFAEGVALVSLTSVRARKGDAASALTAFRELIPHWRRAGDWVHQWTTMRNLVELLARLGAHEAAATLHAATVAAASAAPVFGADADRLTDTGATLCTALGPARLDEAVRRGRAMSDEETVAFALCCIDDALATATP